METNEKKQITDILNAFRLINKDIRASFKIMSEKLESKSNFTTWKKSVKGNKNARIDYRDDISLFDGYDRYDLNCYGLYDGKVIGFTFVISVNYNAEVDTNYKDLLKQLGEDINLNTPMLCIFGIYSPIELGEFKLREDGFEDVVDIVRCDWNYDKEEGIKYDKWFDFEVEYLEDGNVKEGYEGWYKSAKIKINHITDISSKEIADEYIDDLIKEVKSLT